MSSQPTKNVEEQTEITIVTIKTPSGEKQIPLPKEAGQLLNEYNIEFNLSQKLGDSIIAVQQAKQRSENKSQTMLLELLTLSNQTSMEIGKIQARKEMEDEKTKADEDNKKKEGEQEIEIKNENPSENKNKSPKEPKAPNTKKPTKKKSKK